MVAGSRAKIETDNTKETRHAATTIFARRECGTSRTTSAPPTSDATTIHALTSGPPTPKVSRKYVGAGMMIHSARKRVAIAIATASQRVTSWYA